MITMVEILGLLEKIMGMMNDLSAQVFSNGDMLVALEEYMTNIARLSIKLSMGLMDNVNMLAGIMANNLDRLNQLEIMIGENSDKIDALTIAIIVTFLLVCSNFIAICIIGRRTIKLKKCNGECKKEKK